MAGLDDTGLTINRLEDVVTDLNTEASVIFQDLVPEGDTVDTSASTSLGRIIGLVSPAISDLWEGVQEVHSAFNPNSATGIALDDLVMLGGLTRFTPSPTIAYLMFRGTYLTVIPAGSVVSSASTSKSYVSSSNLTLNASDIGEVGVNLSSVSNSTLYGIVFTGDVTRTVSFTSDSDATQAEILNGLAASVASVASSYFTSSINVDTLTITSINPLHTWDITITGPITVSKIGKVVEAVCEENGPNEQLIGTINTIQTPVLGWDSATNPVEATPGNERETDDELRLRFKLSKYVRGSNIVDSLYSDLLALPGVETVKILVNDTESTDGNSIPPHAFMAVVEGGISQDIGEIIWENKPAGIATYGTTSVTVKDIQDQDKTVYFKRPTEVPIYIDLEITDTGSFPENGEELIKQALVDYFIANQAVGDDVIYSRLYTPINSVPGHYVTLLQIDDTASPAATTNISIDDISVASLEAVNINITVT